MTRSVAAAFALYIGIASVSVAIAQPAPPGQVPVQEQSDSAPQKALKKEKRDKVDKQEKGGTDNEQNADKQDKDDKKSRRGDILSDTPDTDTQLAQLQHSLTRLPFAAGLASLLALRPRRRGTPKRQASVVQTQIILAIVGAVVMLVVGTSLARAFGIVGAAGLVRYRSKIADPKDAGVMLSTLAIGLASGVGLWMMAIFAAGFVVAVLWVIESFEPTVRNLFMLTVTSENPDALKPEVEAILRRAQIRFELREASPDRICYETKLRLDQKTDALSQQLLGLASVTAVQWEEKKEKKE